MELRELDGAVSLQPLNGAATPLEPSGGLRLGVLQGRFRALQRAARSGGNAVLADPSFPVLADLPEARCRVLDPCDGVDAGAEPQYGDQPGFRQLRANAYPQRHGR